MIAIVERTIYHNQENGYTVLSVMDGKEHFVATCNLPFSPDKGQHIEIEGQWVNDPRYGKQLKATYIQVNDPTTADGIKAYLSSGIISGIGPVTAERIVSMFSADTLKILDEEPKKLLKVKGIGNKILDRIADSWKEKREGAKIVAELCNIGLSVTYATKVYKQYGNNSIAVVKDNPYRLADEIWGIGFIKADEIASKIGFNKEHPFRVQSGILYTLKEAQNEGHCFLPVDELKNKATKILKVEKEFIEKSLKQLSEEKTIVNTSIFSTTVCYLPFLFYAERYIEKRIKELSNKPYRGLDFEPDKTIEENLLSDEQFQASSIAETRHLSVITGSAGTGKTTTLKAIINCLEKNSLSYTLCAPTGKASKRITEVTQREAKTIHRLLEVDQFGNFRRNEENPLEYDFIIVDEASMVDIFLMASLLKAMHQNSSLILIGDPNQLPPVGAGNVFKDIINSGICPVLRLTKIQRQKETSNVIKIANSIINGNMPYIPNTNDSFLFNISEPESIASKIVTLVMTSIPEKLNVRFEDIQVLSPMKKGIIGTDSLNKMIQEAVQNENDLSLRGFRFNDKVMQIRNNYKKEIFNGDIGYVTSIDKEEKKLTVTFEGRGEIEYDYSELDELTLAYCCTVHKYQGSETKCVVIPIHTQHFIMLKRDLLYTAVTRTREILIILGTNKALAIGVRNNTEQKRYTGLFKGLSCNHW